MIRNTCVGVYVGNLLEDAPKGELFSPKTFKSNVFVKYAHYNI